MNAKKIIDTYENFALVVTALAAHSDSANWPYVTVPAFEAQATQIMSQTGSRSFGIAHKVLPEEAEAWVNYTLANQWWKRESLDYHGLSNVTADPIVPFIWGDFRNFGPTPPVEKYGFYMPVWQGAPISDGGIANFDSFR